MGVGEKVKVDGKGEVGMGRYLGEGREGNPLASRSAKSE